MKGCCYLKRGLEGQASGRSRQNTQDVNEPLAKPPYCCLTSAASEKLYSKTLLKNCTRKTRPRSRPPLPLPERAGSSARFATSGAAGPPVCGPPPPPPVFWFASLPGPVLIPTGAAPNPTHIVPECTVPLAPTNVADRCSRSG